MATGTEVLTSKRNEFIRDILKGKITDSYSIAHATVSYLRKTVAQQKWAHADELMTILRYENQQLSRALPKHFVVGNMAKRILKLVREENSSLPKGADETTVDSHDSLQKLWEGGTSRAAPVSSKQLRRSVIETIGEFLTELETCQENILVQATDHIASGDTVMSIGHSSTVEAFLKAAGKRHKFKLLVVECAPFYRGKLLADSFKAVQNVDVKLISDTAMFSSMTQVNKVVLGAKAVFADGGLQAVCGAYTLCLAAKHFCVPVIVCSSFYKLTPLFVSQENQDTYNVLESPQPLVPFSDGRFVDRLECYNPMFDYVSPDLVTLFITNVSGNVPSYIYRLLAELYHPDDVEI